MKLQSTNGDTATVPDGRDVRLDVTLLGASGFTGRYIAAELLRSARQHKLSVGLAARDTHKLRQSLSAQLEAADDKETQPMVRLLHADISSTVSLDQLCRRSRLVINACGPYHRLGAPVIEACLRAGTHYLDICGEQLFIEQCEARLHDEAQRQRVFCVSTCGFDSIPAELASLAAERAFRQHAGRLATLRCYMQPLSGAAGYDGVHMGTWTSSIHGTTSEPALALHRWRHAVPTRPHSGAPHRPALKPPLHKAVALNGAWCVPFPGPDVSVHARSQRVLRRGDNAPPVSMQQFVAVSSWWRGFTLLLAAIVFGVLCYLPGGHKLLHAFPTLFSSGLVSRHGPSERQVREARLNVVCEADGWSGEQKASPTTGAPDRHITVHMRFPEAAYATTALCVTQCALCVLQEREKMPGEGGVLPPGAAFANTTLMQRLQENGVKIIVDTA